MTKECWKPGNMVYPLPAVMVSCGHTEDEHNIITIAWTGTVNTNPAMVYISVRKERHSYDIIKRTGDFVINLTTEDLAFATDWCGVRSGRKFDKFKEMKLTKEEAKVVKSPLIKESPINIECVVKDIVELGSHDMFVAEVVNINYDTKYIDPNTDEFSLAAARPIVYSHGKYFSLGKKIGKFGYSVEKKKK